MTEAWETLDPQANSTPSWIWTSIILRSSSPPSLVTVGRSVPHGGCVWAGRIERSESSAITNRLLFQLVQIFAERADIKRLNSHRNPTITPQWNTHGTPTELRRTWRNPEGFATLTTDRRRRRRCCRVCCHFAGCCFHNRFQSLLPWRGTLGSANLSRTCWVYLDWKFDVTQSIRTSA